MRWRQRQHSGGRVGSSRGSCDGGGSGGSGLCIGGWANVALLCDAPQARGGGLLCYTQRASYGTVEGGGGHEFIVLFTIDGDG